MIKEISSNEQSSNSRPDIKLASPSIDHELDESNPLSSADSSVKSISHKNDFIIQNIETIYQRIGTELPYHRISKILLFAVVLFSSSIFWVEILIMNSIREDVFCYNVIDNQLEACSTEDICKNQENAVTILIFDRGNSTDNYTENFDKSIEKVNKKYQGFFRDQYLQVFSKEVYNRFDFLTSNQNKFIGGVILTSQEQANLSLKFFDLCTTDNMLITMGVFSFVGFLISNIVMSTVSDVIGRKKTIVFALVIAFGFSLAFYLFSYRIGSLNVFALPSTQYEDILMKIKTQNSVYNSYRSYKITFCFFAFGIAFAGSALINSSLALVLENSLNDVLVLRNFTYFNCVTTGLSPFIGYLTTYTVNDFTYAFLIHAIMFFTLFFLVIFFVYESPRQYFEYSEWENLTDVLKKICTKLDDNLFSNREILDKAKKADETVMYDRKSKLNKSVHYSRNSVYTYYQKNMEMIKSAIFRGDNIIFKRDETKSNPLLIWSCMIFEKRIHRNYPILIALCLIIHFIFYLMTNQYLSRYFFTKSGLFSIWVVNSSFFVVIFVNFFSNFFFYWAWHFFGFHSVTLFCFIGTFIFGIIYEGPLMVIPKYSDLNQYNTKLIDNFLVAEEEIVLRMLIYFLHFFINGLYYVLFLFLFKYTKTLYRCVFFGVVDNLSRSAFYFHEIVAFTYSRVMILASIASFIGIFTVIFTDEAKDELYIISDKKRKL